jgi:threonine/homoserine/homoserine lactone efflux protein
MGAMDALVFPRGMGLGFAVAATVGPISLLVIRRTLAEGRMSGLASGLGVATADASYGALAAFGLTAVTSLLVEGRRPLGVVGGAILLWLAWQTLRSVPAAAAEERLEPWSRRDLAAAWASLFGLTLTNPMTILSFAALFVGLGVTGGDAGGAALLSAGVWAGSALWWVILTSAVSRLRGRVTPRALRGVNVASGTLIGAFALVAIGSAIAA